MLAAEPICTTRKYWALFVRKEGRMGSWWAVSTMGPDPGYKMPQKYCLSRILRGRKVKMAVIRKAKTLLRAQKTEPLACWSMDQEAC